MIKELRFILCLFFILFNCYALAVDFNELPTLARNKNSDVKPIITPTAPNLTAKSYILLDADSGKVLASKEAEVRYEPASLTKMMSMYVISDAIKQGRLKATDKVRVSKSAWKMGGSKMFLKAGQEVTVEDLIKGIIVQSGNDATIAMAEHMAGSESAFVDLMNQQAEILGMHNTHFVTSTGLPDPEHYTTAHDMAILSRAIIKDHPEHYHWYKDKWYSFNGIKQPNRNRLLWRDEDIDGIKTGHTKSAGYCLAASASKKGMRLISIILGASSEAARANDSQRLLNYGYRFFETHHLYKSEQPLVTSRIWFGARNILPVGLKHDLSVTIPFGTYKYLKADISMPNIIKAPVKAGSTIGNLNLLLNHEKIYSEPLIALKAVRHGSLWQSFKDRTKLMFYKWFGVNTQKA